MRRKFAVISGFLGSGKTTGMLAISKYLSGTGVKAAIISNDLGGNELVDAMYIERNYGTSGSIADGCICYQTELLADTIKRFADCDGAGLVMSDIPGCGVGALDHVYFKLAREYPDDFELAPFTVICDPARLRSIMPERADINLPREMDYLFRTQLLEADVIVLNKCDTVSEAERRECVSFLNASYPDIPVFTVSALSGSGIAELSQYLTTHCARLAQVDTGYGGEAFMAAESKLSWYDCRFIIRKEQAFDGNVFAEEFIDNVRARLKAEKNNVPHLKLFISGEGGDYAKASLVGVDYDAGFDRRLENSYGSYDVVVNARAACPSSRLADVMREALYDSAAHTGAFSHVLSSGCFGMTDG